MKERFGKRYAADTGNQRKFFYRERSAEKWASEQTYGAELEDLKDGAGMAIEPGAEEQGGIGIASMLLLQAICLPFRVLTIFKRNEDPGLLGRLGKRYVVETESGRSLFISRRHAESCITKKGSIIITDIKTGFSQEGE